MCRSSKVRQVIEAAEESEVQKESSLTDSSFNLFASTPKEEIQRRVVMNGKEVTILIDTGADVNVLPWNSGVPIDLQSSSARVQAWGQYDIPVIGKTRCVVSYKGMEVQAEFTVVKLSDNATAIPLFSLPLCQKLGMIKELLQVRKLNFFDDYSDLFDGIGCLNTGFQYVISLKDNATPRNIPARRLPPGMADQVHAELIKMRDNGIIRPVKEATDWCSPMLVTRKKSGDIRIVIDFRLLNTAVRRENYQIPRLDDMLPSLANAKIFSALDGTSGYHQIPVHPKSQHLLTFSSSWGRWCFERLPFGISSASEVFQRAMSELLTDLPGVICYQDDVLVYGKDESEHDQRLRSVLDRFRSSGIKLNKAKCKIGVKELDFMGHHLSNQGISPSLDKVSALASMPRPETSDALRSFLGMAVYIGQRFVPNFSSICQPLWSLLSKHPFTWDKESDQAFRNVRAAISKPTTLVYFNDRLPIVLAVDASPCGLGATISQDG